MNGQHVNPREETVTSIAGAEFAAELDARDPLADFRRRFVVDDPELIYLDGNSLGRLPKATSALAADLVNRQWGERLIRGWNDGWIEAPERIGAKIARLIGAQPDEVIVADSTSVNLFKLAVAALQFQAGRHTILTDTLNFPSDVYVLEGIMELLRDGRRLQVVPSPDGVHGLSGALIAAMNGDTALLTLSHTVFKSGYVYDMDRLTSAAHRAGALVLWDLSHSAGAVPVNLNGANADLAVGCTYKYLNGGPGAPAFLYVRRDLQDRLSNPIAGWMGRANAFDFGFEYRPAPGLRRFLTGSPAVISLSLIEPGVDLILEAGMDCIRAKSEAMSAFFIDLWESELRPLGFTLNSPRDAARRGSHVSLGHPDALRIDQALIKEMDVIPDFRSPDTIRFGFAPLYNTFAEISQAVYRLQVVVKDGLYERYSVPTSIVT